MLSNILVDGGCSLRGTVKISGSKNSALKLIAAALFSDDDVTLENVPHIENVTNDLKVVKALGGSAEWVGENKLVINGAGINTHEIPYELGSKYRTAVLYAAALVYRFGKAIVPIPVGCRIGLRPMNRWVDTWEAFGIHIECDDTAFYLNSKNIGATNISFKLNTHMGTDNALLFSAFAPGETVINNAAEEPEVDDLIKLLNLMGGEVERVEPRKIRVTGCNKFNGGNFSVQCDRNEVVTYAVAALVTGGNITIVGVDKLHLLAFVNVLTKIGAKFEFSGNELRVWKGDEDLQSVDVTTAPYPGFMTDWQPLITLLLTYANGESLVHDTVYWDRFGYTKDLNRMGAKIELMKPSELGIDSVVSEDTYNFDEMGEPATVARIAGPTKLKGAKLQIPDLRAGATLIVAALSAEGKSELIGFENVERGYEAFLDKLSGLGAGITALDK